MPELCIYIHARLRCVGILALTPPSSLFLLAPQATARERFGLGALSLTEVSELLRVLRGQGCLRVREVGGEAHFSAVPGARPQLSLLAGGS